MLSFDYPERERYLLSSRDHMVWASTVSDLEGTRHNPVSLVRRAAKDPRMGTARRYTLTADPEMMGQASMLFEQIGFEYMLDAEGILEALNTYIDTNLTRKAAS